MGFFSDRVPLLSLGRKKAFLKRIQAAEQQVQQGEWLAELNQYIRKTVSALKPTGSRRTSCSRGRRELATGGRCRHACRRGQVSPCAAGDARRWAV